MVWFFIAVDLESSAGGDKEVHAASVIPTTAPKVTSNGGKWGKFMQNGTGDPTPNGSVPKTHKSVDRVPEPTPPETSEVQWNAPRPVASAHSQQLVQVLIDIKEEIKSEVNTLNSKIERLDGQIETLLDSLVASPQTIEVEPNPKARVTHESNGSLKAPKKLGKLLKTTRVSPQHVPIPQPSQDEPTISPQSQQQPSSVELSTMTTATTLDSLAQSADYQLDARNRKSKIKDLDML